MTTPTQDLSNAGVSIWLDDLSRTRINSGNLQELIDTANVVGVTTNPAILQQAITNPDDSSYDEQLAVLAAQGVDAETAVFAMASDDVAAALDIFKPVYQETQHVDGRVSLEVSPDLAHDAAGTLAQAKQLWRTIDRPNLLIKIPATQAGLPAIADAIAAGISVNVTLIFSLERYAAVIEAYLSGLERAQAQGVDLSSVYSVASFFVSRVDSEVDAQLKEIGTEEALGLTGKAGLANARLAYQLYEDAFASPRAQALLAAGANPQRPLWASTGVKDPSLPDTLYVTGLVAADVVNTMPEKTLQAVVDHGVTTGDTITGTYEESQQVLDSLAAVGIDFAAVTEKLETEGVAKFIDSWHDLLGQVGEALEAQR